jgi:peroxiredoxin
MATDLTGDFDVIAQFAVPAVNRVLAAMHRAERFQHSVAMRVDDTARPPHDLGTPTVVGVIDAFGDTVSDHAGIGNPRPLTVGAFAGGSAINAAIAALDPLVNIHISGIHLEPIEPSHFKGRAQLQLFPPTIEIPDSSGTNLTVKIEMMSRYLPDQGSPPLAEYIRGDLRITTRVNQVVSQKLGTRVVAIDVKASSAVINFTPSWSSAPIGAPDLSGISLLIRNALKTSFLPSNATLPQDISRMQFKTMSGQHPAVAVLLDMESAAGNPASANQVFLTGTDGFALGVGASYVHAKLQPTLDKILEQQVDPVHFKYSTWVHTWNITYTITLSSAALSLENGKMVMVIKGHAHTGTSWLPDFDFTVKQDITLAVNGGSASLALGNMSLDTSSWIINYFKGGAMQSLERVRDGAIAQSGANGTVDQMLSADKNLGGFLKSLLTPASGTPTPIPLNFSFAYTSAEIRPTGIVLHGIVSVPNWPPPRIEYEQIASTPGSGPGAILGENAFGRGPDYSALKTWIPGGTIQNFQWRKQNETQGYTDEHRFVLLGQPVLATEAAGDSPPVLSGYSPMCLTVNGVRLAAGGAVANQSVSATMCGFRHFPVGGDFGLATDAITAAITLARRGADGLVDVVGHAAVNSAAGKAGAPNLLIHFAGERTRDSLESLTQALRESGRADAATAILVVAEPDEISKLKFSDSITYVEDDGSWRKRYGIKNASGPATVVVDPSGKVVWQGDGSVEAPELSGALRKSLVKATSRAGMHVANVRIGQKSPNFLFDFAPHEQITLRKLAGRRVTLVFFRSSSKPSVEAVKEIVGSGSGKDSPNQIVLAICDGESTAKMDLGAAVVVADPDRSISKAYGIAMWPTVVTIDEAGTVRSVGYGRTGGAKSRA